MSSKVLERLNLQVWVQSDKTTKMYHGNFFLSYFYWFHCCFLIIMAILKKLKEQKKSTSDLCFSSVKISGLVCNKLEAFHFWVIASSQLQFVGNKAKGRIAKRMFQEYKTPNSPKNEHFLPTDMHTVCVSSGKKDSFFRKFGVLCFLETSALRFTLLPYYRRSMLFRLICSRIVENLWNVIKSHSGSWSNWLDRDWPWQESFWSVKVVKMITAY